jgi:hypothetical protein
MTTVTANAFVTEEKLRFIARERDWKEQQRLYERLLEGQLRSTRSIGSRRGTAEPKVDSPQLPIPQAPAA